MEDYKNGKIATHNRDFLAWVALHYGDRQFTAAELVPLVDKFIEAITSPQGGGLT